MTQKSVERGAHTFAPKVVYFNIVLIFMYIINEINIIAKTINTEKNIFATFIKFIKFGK